jgi:regulator of protease activity HflC (stomatin/prohibitin superfamily)
MVSLARTTLRNIIGTLSLKSANSERNKINKELYDTLMNETKSWGVEIIRAELKQIEPPKDVQSTMNQVVKAENEKIAAIDFATAKETEADGQKRATIKHAEGVRKSRILHAEGEAEAIRLVNEAANKYFVGNAQILKRLETLENALEENTTIVVPENSDLVNVIGDLAGILPINKKHNDHKL